MWGVAGRNLWQPWRVSPEAEGPLPQTLRDSAFSAVTGKGGECDIAFRSCRFVWFKCCCVMRRWKKKEKNRSSLWLRTCVGGSEHWAWTETVNILGSLDDWSIFILWTAGCWHRAGFLTHPLPWAGASQNGSGLFPAFILLYELISVYQSLQIFTAF